MVETKHIRLPLTTDDVLGLRVGELVTLSGVIFTGRDRIHKLLSESAPSEIKIPFDISGSVIYHCGPIVKEENGSYKVLAAGPTTSMRMEMYAETVIRQYGIRGIMGKGGMGQRTLHALGENACVYFHTIGGAAVYLADRITKTLGVWKLEEFGIAEAMWRLEISDFPAIVTMDCHGGNIHRDIELISSDHLARIIGK